MQDETEHLQVHMVINKFGAIKLKEMRLIWPDGKMKKVGIQWQRSMPMLTVMFLEQARPGRDNVQLVFEGDNSSAIGTLSDALSCENNSLVKELGGLEEVHELFDHSNIKQNNKSRPIQIGLKNDKVHSSMIHVVVVVDGHSSQILNLDSDYKAVINEIKEQNSLEPYKISLQSSQASASPWNATTLMQFSANIFPQAVQFIGSADDANSIESLIDLFQRMGDHSNALVGSYALGQYFRYTNPIRAADCFVRCLVNARPIHAVLEFRNAMYQICMIKSEVRNLPGITLVNALYQPLAMCFDEDYNNSAKHFVMSSLQECRKLLKSSSTAEQEFSRGMLPVIKRRRGHIEFERRPSRAFKILEAAAANNSAILAECRQSEVCALVSNGDLKSARSLIEANRDIFDQGTFSTRHSMKIASIRIEYEIGNSKMAILKAKELKKNTHVIYVPPINALAGGKDGFFDINRVLGGENGVAFRSCNLISEDEMLDFEKALLN